jgi:hypothetical protein
MRVFLLIAALVFFPMQGFACSCHFQVESLRAELTNRTIFIGRAKGSRLETYTDSNGRSRPNGVTTFSIEECWQGDCDADLELQHPAYPSSCMVTFPLNEPLFLIAYKNQRGKLQASSECMAFHPAMVEHILTTSDDFQYPGHVECEAAEEQKRPTSQDLFVLDQCNRWNHFEEKLRPEPFWLQDRLRK